MPIDPPGPFMGTRRPRAQVRVGVGVVVCTLDNKIYAGIRKNSHGAGRLALPGGHLEVYESWEDCAIREVKEEMDIDVKSVEFLHVTNDIMEEEEKHYVTIFMMTRSITEDVPCNTEPDKCEGWNAYTFQELCEMKEQNSLFGPLEKLLTDRPPALLSALLVDPS